MLVDSIIIETSAWRWWAELHGNLPAMRAAAGMTQRELAAVLHTRQGNVSIGESQRYPVWGIDRLVAWLAALGHVIAATAPEGKTVLLDHWGRDQGRWLKRVRRGAEFEQGELAELLGISKSSVQMIEDRGAAAKATTIVGFLIAADWEVDLRKSAHE